MKTLKQYNGRESFLEPEPLDDKVLCLNYPIKCEECKHEGNGPSECIYIEVKEIIG